MAKKDLKAAAEGAPQKNRQRRKQRSQRAIGRPPLQFGQRRKMRSTGNNTRKPKDRRFPRRPNLLKLRLMNT